MVQTEEIRKRLLRVIEKSRQAALDRRARSVSATRNGERALGQIVVPIFKTTVNVLKVEGYPFQVSTPAGSVRMTAEASGENFIELVLDTTGEAVAFRGRVSRTQGRQVLIEETIVQENTEIAELTEDQVLEFLLGNLGPFLEK